MFTLHRCSNLVFREIYFRHDEAGSAGADVLFVSQTHHLVVDQCTFDYGDCDDDHCDESLHLAAPSTFVTIQRTKFQGYTQNMNIKGGSMLGNFGYDDRSLRVTFFECYFKDGHSPAGPRGTAVGATTPLRRR